MHSVVMLKVRTYPSRYLRLMSAYYTDDAHLYLFPYARIAFNSSFLRFRHWQLGNFLESQATASLKRIEQKLMV